MAGMMKNLGSLFADTRSRTIMLFTTFIVVAGIVVALLVLRARTTEPNSSASITHAPGGIQSIPGALDPTEQYAKLQEEQNISQAKTAAKTGQSAIPTIIRTQSYAEGQQALQAGQGGIGFTALSREAQNGGTQKTLWLQNLKQSDCSASEVADVVKQGATLTELHEACSCMQLKATGYTAEQLKPVCSCTDLKAAGFNALQLKNAEFNPQELQVCGFDACQMHSAGFTAAQLKDGGFSDGELQGAGYTPAEIRAASGLPPGMTAQDVAAAGCNVDTLRRERAEGVSAEAIRVYAGCSPEAMKAAGYTAKELRAAGFTPAELKNAGFTAAQLKDAGFSPAQIAQAFEPLPSDSIKKVADESLPSGITGDDVKKAGCTVAAIEKEKVDGVSAAAIRKYAGCSAIQLRAAGYTPKQSKDAGFTPEQLAVAGFTPAEIRAAEGTANNPLDALRKAGCTVDALKTARAAGISAKTIRDTVGCSAAMMKAAGFTAKQLKDAGFTPGELKRAGFSAAQLKAAGFTAKQLADAGFTPKELKDAGFTAAQLKAAGFNAAQLKDAGFTAAQLKNAGFTAAQMKDAGFTAAQLKDAGYTAAQLKDAGFTSSVPTVNPLTQLTTTQQPSMNQTTASTEEEMGGAPVTDKALQAALARQSQQMSQQRLQQQVQQRQSEMSGYASQLVAGWRSPEQKYAEGTPPKVTTTSADEDENSDGPAGAGRRGRHGRNGHQPAAMIKAGTIMFAVLDTAINSDEPGPILATIVSGEYKGTKLIGSFQLPSNAVRMVITFNTMSIASAGKTIGINAVAIDPDTARTALASSADRHILLRYGSLFASSFLEGFGNAFKSAGTSITIDGANGSTTVASDVGRSTKENAVIALAKVGQGWGNVLSPIFNTPPTVQVYAGTGIGVLFTQDIPPVS